jgi:hypothetical protein
MIETDSTRARAEIEEQRCLIEAQQSEIRRHQHRIEMQRRRIGILEDEIAAIKLLLHRAPLRQPTQRHASNGNGKAHSSPIIPARPPRP